MLKKLLSEIISFILNESLMRFKLINRFFVFDFNKYTIPYTIAGKKPMSHFYDEKQWLKNNVMDNFQVLVDNKNVLMEYYETTENSPRMGKITMISVYYYYPNEYWRVKQLKRIYENFPQYQKSIVMREGLLYGYPKKYISRFTCLHNFKVKLTKLGLYKY